MYVFMCVCVMCICVYHAGVLSREQYFFVLLTSLFETKAVCGVCVYVCICSRKKNEGSKLSIK